MVMFLLSFVKGSKSAEGGPNPLADMDPGGPIPLGIGGSISASGFGPGGPNPLGHLSALTYFKQREEKSGHVVYI